MARKVTWQIRFRNWIGSSTCGLLFVGARRNGRGAWLHGAALPDHLVEGLGLLKLPGQAGNWSCPEFHTLEELREGALEVQWQRSPSFEAKGLWTIEEQTS
jgi:hypothetical protein